MTEVPSQVDTYGSEDSEDWRAIHREEEGDAPADPSAPYRPPTIPVGLPHVVKFSTESGDLPWKERSIVILLSRFADHEGRATVATSTLCRAMRIGSKNTVEKALNLAAHEDVGILRKISGKGGNGHARKSNTYIFLGADRNWQPLPQTKPGIHSMVALARANRRIEQLEADQRDQSVHIEELEADNRDQRAHIENLEAELTRLRNGSHGDFIGHSPTGEVTNENPSGSAGIASHSYETGSAALSDGDEFFIGHKKVTNENKDTSPSTVPRDPDHPSTAGTLAGNEDIDHPGLTNGPAAEPDEGQEYLSRRARVEELVMTHGAYYRRSFSRRGLPGAVEYFSRSNENEQELLRQVRMLEAGEDPRQAGTGPPGQDEEPPDPDRYAFGYCPDCGKPFATFGGAEYCTDCTQRRRRENEA